MKGRVDASARLESWVAERGEPMRVLSVIPGAPAGPVMIFAKRQSKSVSDHGHSVRNFFLHERLRPIGLLRESLRLRREIRSFRPQVIHAHYGTITAMICVLSAAGTPVVITFRGSDLNPSAAVSGIRNRLGRLLSQLASLRASAVICVSEGLRRRLWWRRDRATVLPTGVDTDLFRPRDRLEARRQLGLSLDAHLVAFNCGLDPWVKNIELAESAVRCAASLLPGTELVVMRGDWEPDSVPILLAAADCLLVTSRFEGSPAIVREALACELPVVSVAVGDVANHLAGVHNCCICPADAVELGHAVAGILLDGGRSDGRARAESLSEHTIAHKLLDLYRHVSADM